MSEAIKENSSLELYETAYKLQYVDGNIPEACRIYKALIDEFPNSNECGYAVIQLQKIQANDIAGRIKTGMMTKFQGYMIVAGVIACLILSLIAIFSIKRANAQIEALSLVSQALSIMYGGNDNDALELLNKAKALSGGTLMDPYLLSATIYMNMQHYSSAQDEFEAYQKLTGKTDSVFNKLVTIRIEKEKSGRTATAKIDTLTRSQHSSVIMSHSEVNRSPSTFRQEKKASQQPIVKPRPKIERARPVPPRPTRKGSPTGNPDTISFF